MKVIVQGLWHLGSVTAAGAASSGHDVVGFDADESVIARLNAGKAPVFEPGLDDLIAACLRKGNLRFTADAADLPSEAEILWVTYDTPVDEDDVADVAFVVAQIKEILPSIPDDATVLVSSQLPVGSIARLEGLGGGTAAAPSQSFASSPENLRLGKALDVFLRPDRIVVGVRNERDRKRIAALFSPITDRIEWMSVESAEMTKHAINAFLASSVVFANEIASVCEVVGADAKEVERGLKSEQRIGPKAYLSPGGAFAGGTLARDVEFLKQAGVQGALELPLLASVRASNDAHKKWVRRKLEAFFPDLRNVRITVLGLTYKPGTDTLRRSLAVELCDWLITRQAEVRVHDPRVKDMPAEWSGAVARFPDVERAIEGSSAVVIGTEWPEYRDLSAEMLERLAPGAAVLDPNRFLALAATSRGIRYAAVGSPGK
jgi:UDPglucose 6-dehydrogenase